MLKRASRSLVVAAGVLLVVVSSASATTTTFTVNDTTDLKLANSAGVACASTLGPSDCTLRAAIQAADNIGGNVDLTLPAGTYKLSIPASTTGSPDDDPSTGDLDIDQLGASTPPQVTITGAGAGATVINANPVGRAFTVHSYTGQGYPGLSISGVMIEGGMPSSDSYASDDGGAIYSGGTLTITDSMLTGSTVSTEGGAVYSAGNDLTITDSTIAGNTAAAAAGGGVAVTGGVVQMTNDTIDGNSSESGGGIAYLDPAAAGSMIDNVTIAHNSGIYGGGLYNPVYAGSIANTIVAANTNTGGSSGAADCYGESVANNAPDEASTADFGGNLDSDGTCFVNGVNGDRAGVDPKLATLSDSNGGSTPTDAFDADSPAISLGLASACPATDQRGFDRLSAHCDAGAYQGDEADLAVTGTGTSIAAPGASFLETFTITNDGPYTAQGVTFSDAFPASANGAANASQGTCTGGASVSCQLGTLSAGQSVTVTAHLTTLSTATIVGTGTVSASSLDGNAANNAAAVSTAVGSPPVARVRPVLSGYLPPVKGYTLTANAGTWTGSGVSFAYQWLRCDIDDNDGSECDPIGGATGNSYSVTSADVAKRLVFEVTATDAFGSWSVYSQISDPVIDNVLQVSSTTTNGASVDLPLECATTANEINPVCVLLIVLSGGAVNQNALTHGKAKSKATVYARKQVKVEAGTKVNIPVKLNHAGQVRLAKRHRLTLKLTISEGGHVLSTRAVTFKYKKPKKRKAG
jgi:predicted outer membrane repeat protein